MSTRPTWINHDGKGRPVPLGTLVEVQMFNGEVRSFRAGAATFARDGSPTDPSRGRWSGWDHGDGGPMAPKFRRYRVVTDNAVRQRNAAMFRSWLDVREGVPA